MKQTILLFSIFLSGTLLAQTEGAYFTQADCESNKIDTTYHYIGGNETHVTFVIKGVKTPILKKDIYAFVTSSSGFYRCDEKLGVLQMYTVGKIGVFAPPNFNFKFDSDALIQSSYLSEGRTGELKRVSKKRLEEILKNDMDLLEKYLTDKDVLYAIKMYNSRHK